MLTPRVIPCLQLVGESLVKAVRFGRYEYIGDPANTVRIFNELEVDELCFLDIRASRERRGPNLRVLADIAAECFMPLSYGGGVRDVETARQILSIGFEKIVVNTAACERPSLLSELAERLGSQSVIAAIDVKRDWWGRPRVYSCDGTRKELPDPVSWARELERRGAGELLVTAMEREGTWEGYDLELVGGIARAVRIPVIANGGAGRVEHLGDALHLAGASAVAVGSMVVYQRRGMGVLINFPERPELVAALLRQQV